MFALSDHFGRLGAIGCVGIAVLVVFLLLEIAHYKNAQNELRSELHTHETRWQNIRQLTPEETVRILTLRTNLLPILDYLRSKPGMDNVLQEAESYLTLLDGYTTGHMTTCDSELRSITTFIREYQAVMTREELSNTVRPLQSI